ncbi:Rrf2 family transcriptional regulator [Streptomyces sp. NBC_01176]|uniref:Rrf2 family transcriptional regulator n=1 Tax=Streptomyces sp. NBC_01176 TaxID=2903760 RepID=UPI00386D33A9
MSANSTMTTAVHVLTLMSLNHQANEVTTSQRIAESVNTHAVVIRRCLGDLRRAGLVRSRRGAGAGWALAREPEHITLLEVCSAVDAGSPFGLHRTPPNSACPVGFRIRPALCVVYGSLEEQLRKELARTTIADVLREALVQQRQRIRGLLGPAPERTSTTSLASS